MTYTAGFVRFNTGEISAMMSGRVDTEEYNGACQVLKNMIPSIQGPVSRRGGTRYIASVKDGTKKTRLMSFQYSADQSYLLEFGDKYMRCFYHRSPVMNDAGTVYEIETPYIADDLEGLYFAQSGDVVYIAHKKYPLKTLTRMGQTNWILKDVDFVDGPYLPVNSGDISITPSGTTGAITLTASAALFKETDVGRQVRLMHTQAPNILWGAVVITGFTNDKIVSAKVQDTSPLMNTGATKFWRLGAFSKSTGYAAAVTFFEQRLILARGNGVYGSKIAQYDVFSPTEMNGTVTGESGYGCEISSEQINDVCWLSSGRSLSIGTVGADFTLAVGVTDTNLPLTVKVHRHSTFGSEAIAPVRVSNTTLFVQHYGRKLRAFMYDSNSDDYVARDLTTLAAHMTFGGIKEMAMQQEPIPIIWCVLKNGKLAGLTYEAEESVSAWHSHEFINGFVESAASIPAVNGERDELYLIVKRTINGQTVRYIEVMEAGLAEDAENSIQAFFVDAGITYSGTKTKTIIGLNHLEGQNVAVLADGAVQNNKVVANGSITLDSAASVVHVGLPFTSVLQTMPLANCSADKTSETSKKRINSLLVRFYKTIGFKCGIANATEQQSFRLVNDLMGVAPALFTGDKKIPFSGGWTDNAVARVEQVQPLPMTILGIFPNIVVNRI